MNFPDFAFTLSSAMNGTIIDPSTQVDIIGDGTAVSTPGLYVRNAVVDNTAGTVMVPVLLGGPEGAPSASTVTVHYTTANGSASAGTDYTATSGTLTFGPGQTAKNIVVPIIDRSGAAPSRNFSVSLSSPTNAVITNGTGVVTIGASGRDAGLVARYLRDCEHGGRGSRRLHRSARHAQCARDQHRHGELRHSERWRLQPALPGAERHPHVRARGDAAVGPGTSQQLRSGGGGALELPELRFHAVLGCERYDHRPLHPGGHHR